MVRAPIMLVSALFMSFKVGGRMAMVYVIVIPILAVALGLIVRSVTTIFRGPSSGTTT